MHSSPAIFSTKENNRTLKVRLFSWQECQLWNQTFDEELGNVDVTEIRQLMDEVTRTRTIDDPGKD